MGATFNNPPDGYSTGTDEDDTFIVTDRGTSFRVLVGKEGRDKLTVERAPDARSFIEVIDTFGHGNFDGRVNDSPYGPSLTFMDMEDVRITGSQVDDFVTLKVGPTSAGLEVYLDAAGGQDLLEFNFDTFTQSVNFIATTDVISSTYGQFAGFEVFKIYGGSGNDTIRTRDGADTLRGGAGTNILDGGAGNDSFYSISLTDFSDGGEGYDFWQANWSAATGPLTVDLGADIKLSGTVVATNVESVSVGGGTGDDRFTVTRTEYATLYGGGGTDTLISDSISEQSRSFQVNSEATVGLYGDANGTSFTEFERVEFKGGALDDSFRVSGQISTDQIIFDAGAGTDRLTARFELLAGATTFIVNADGSVTTNRGQYAGFEVFNITGGNQGNTIVTAARDDRIVGGASDDILKGGAGNDEIIGGLGNDDLDGEGGDDIIELGSGQNEALGGAGNDTFRLTAVSTGAPVSNLDGGADVDTADFTLVRSALVFQISAAAPGVIRVEDKSLVNVEKVIGGSGGNIFNFADSTSGIEAQGSDRVDTFVHGSGADRFFGEDGNDSFMIGAGDYAHGGWGDDEFILSGPFGGAQTAGEINGDLGRDTLKLDVAFNIDLQGATFVGPGTATSGSATFALNFIEVIIVAAHQGEGSVVRGRWAGETFSVNPLFNDGSVGVLFEGRGGNDQLFGSNAADELIGGDGNDLLDGGLGADILRGGIGNDIYVIDEADTIDEAADAGSDEIRTAITSYTLAGQFENLTGLGSSGQTLVGNALGNVITGGSGDDMIEGAGGNDRLIGGAGRDYLTGGANADVILGGIAGDIIFGQDGEDQASGEDGDDYIDGGSERDVLDGGGGRDHLIGGLGHDSLSGGGDNDLLFGDDGEDDLRGGEGNDYVVGGAGRDAIAGDAGQDTLYGGTDTDVMTGGDAEDFLFGEDGDDYLDGGGERDVLLGGAGGDNLLGRLGNDSLLGGAGLDILSGEGGDDELRGGDGDDYLAGGIGRDFLVGDAGGDALFGNDDGDVLLGAEGDDLLFGEDGDDYAEGGSERDVAYGGAGRDDLRGGSGHDSLLGDADGDFLRGEDGEDELRGGDGDDHLEGGAGRDFAIGDAGDDTLHGGADIDILLGGEGNDFVFGEDGGDNIEGNGGRDVLFGGAARDYIFGGGDGDALFGGDDGDILFGEADADELRGEAGDDYLDGGLGNDLLIGGAGGDTLIGGAGADTFLFLAAGDSGPGFLDIIQGFDAAAGDRIDLSIIDAVSGTPGNEAFTFLGTGAFTQRAGELRYEVVDGRAIVHADLDGNGTADFTFLVDTPTLQGSDFVL